MDPLKKQRLDELWIDQLIERAYAPSNQSAEQRLVAQVLERIEAEPEKKASIVSRSEHAAPRSRFSLRNMSAMAIAASLLVLAFFLSSVGEERSAYAAVIRASKAVMPNRKYSLTILADRALAGRRPMQGELYVDDKDRFVVSYPGLFGASKIWIGGSANDRWIVPPRGPAFQGSADLIGGWLARKDANSPYLHLDTILDRMTKAYKLKTLPSETLDSPLGMEGNVRCVHVRGEVRATNTHLPRTIDLWADENTGIAQRVILDWERSVGERGPRQWTLELESTTEVADDWFQLSGHIAKERKVVRPKNLSELDGMQGSAEVE